MSGSLQERLQQAFSSLAAGQVDVAAREFSLLAGHDEVSSEAYRGLAAANWRMKRADVTVGFLRKSLEIAPKNTEARADLALVMMLTGQPHAAGQEWERVIALKPDDADVWHNYAKVLSDVKAYDAARGAFERSLALKPDRVPTLSSYARVLAALSDWDAAEKVWERVIALGPAAMTGYEGLAQTQFSRGQLERSLETYRRGIEASPQSPELHMGYAQVREDLADRAGAEQSFRRALELRPGWAHPLEGLLTLIRGKAEPELLAKAEAVVNDQRREAADRANVGFGLGKALDGQDKPEQAFAAWRAANAARRAHVGGYDHARFVEQIDRMIAVFSAERLQQFSALGSSDERPVFVLGMPRSGTTLVEQIIASHSQARGLGELPDIGRIARTLPQRSGSIQRWPEVMAAIDGATLKAAAADYLGVMLQREPRPALRLVDKAPLNYLNAGLIALLFPRARIIWCRRDPRDICVSIYGENFALEQTWATDLADLGRYFRQHMRLMRHWQAALPGRIYECVYEDLIAQPEAQARALIHALDLPWEDACLKFYQQERAVLTPSRWQVRQPIYTSSVARWRRYEPWIGPLAEALGDEVPA